MALTIYGTHRSRTMRVLWTAAELGLDYQHVPLTVDDPWLKSPAFLAISPNRTIPAIVDDGFALAESMAINLYLTKRHAPGSLYPESLEGEADTWRWSLWAQGQLEPWVMQDARLADLRGAAAASMRQEVERALGLLDRELTARAFLLGEAFTVADLNVAGVLSPSRAGKLDLEPCPQLRAWLERCYDRPAALGVRARYA
ncbi:MAG TPA: glutathione S-transferase family protein [Caulobacteraceae bacterium]|nr:glutathione S-transferase family protein [Caulobacteraceae bacterium]